jgi:enoyl-CoA hydratase/carnithine racemase
MEMIMTAGMVTSDDAYRMGLVNHVVPRRTAGFLKLPKKIMKTPLAIVTISLSTLIKMVKMALNRNKILW